MKRWWFPPDGSRWWTRMLLQLPIRGTASKNWGQCVKSTGADSPLRYGTVEIWNGTLANTVQYLLYSSGLSVKYWSVVILHAVYLQNWCIDSTIKSTPYEAWNRLWPNLKQSKLFRSYVYVRYTGHRRTKLDRHDFGGICIRYGATNQNIDKLILTATLPRSPIMLFLMKHGTPLH